MELAFPHKTTLEQAIAILQNAILERHWRSIHRTRSRYTTASGKSTSEQSENDSLNTHTMREGNIIAVAKQTFVRLSVCVSCGCTTVSRLAFFLFCIVTLRGSNNSKRIFLECNCMHQKKTLYSAQTSIGLKCGHRKGTLISGVSIALKGRLEW